MTGSVKDPPIRPPKVTVVPKSSSASSGTNKTQARELESHEAKSTGPAVQKFLDENVYAASSSAVQQAQLASSRMSIAGLYEAIERVRAQTPSSPEADLEQLERLVNRTRACQNELGKLGEPTLLGPELSKLAKVFETLLPGLRERARLARKQDAALSPVFDKRLEQLAKLGAAMGLVTPSELEAGTLIEQPPQFGEAQALLRERGAKIELQIDETARGRTQAIRILPDPKTRLGRIAKRLEAHGVELVFSPLELQLGNARGIYSRSRTFRRLYLDFEAIASDTLSTAGKHELRHAKFHWARDRGEDSMFQMSFHAFTNTTLSRSSDIYQHYMSAEELSTFPQGLRHEVELLSQARADSNAPPVPYRFQSSLEGTIQLGNQTKEVTQRALRRLDEVLSETASKSFLRSLSTSQLIARHRPSAYLEHDSVSFMVGGAYLEVPIVTGSQKSMYERVENARAKLEQYLESKSGLGLLLASRKEIRALRDELHDAQRALLTNLRAKISKLSTHADNITKESNQLLGAVRKYEALRYGGTADAAVDQLAQRYDALVEQALSTSTRMVRLGRTAG